jgi:hypothetical protein
MSKAYDVLFDILKTTELNQISDPSPFTFTAHGKEQNLNYQLYYNRMPAGSIEFIPGEGLDDRQQEVRMLNEEAIAQIITSFKQKEGQLRDICLQTIESILYGLNGRFWIAKIGVVGRGDLGMEGALLDNNGEIIGKVQIRLALVVKGKYELLQETINKKVSEARATLPPMGSASPDAKLQDVVVIG